MIMHLLLAHLRRRCALLCAAAALLALTYTNVVNAATCSSGPTPATLTITLSGGVIRPDPGLAVGALLTPLGTWQSMGTAIWRCSSMYSPFLKVNLTPLGRTHSAYSTYSTVFKTNVDGVGLVIFTNYYTLNGPGWEGNYYGVHTSWTRGNDIFGNGGVGVRFTLAFVKTGPISPGNVNMSGIIGQVGIGDLSGGSPTGYIANIAIAGGPEIIPPTCTIPDADIELPPTNAGQFKGPGSVSANRVFELVLTGCPKGFSAIRCSIALAPGIAVVDATRGILGLRGDSSAQGLALQIFDDRSQALSLNKPYAASSYNASVGGNVPLTLEAAWHQIDARITPGMAYSQAILTLDYQ